MPIEKAEQITFILGGVTGGGAERVAVHLMNEWIRKGYHIHLISMRGEQEDRYTIPTEVTRTVLGGEGESSNKWAGLIKNVFYIRKLRKAVRKSDSGIVISFLTRANIYAILVCVGLRKRIIISERNDTNRQQQDWPWAALREKLYRHADVVTANSAVALESMKQYVPATKLALVPNPVVIPAETDLASPDSSITILSVARLAPHKRLDLVIKALSKTSKMHPEWSLKILGEGEERENLRLAAEAANLKDRVELRGFVPDPSSYYRTAAVFVLPSLYEGTPNAMLEAMSYGLPCIVSDSLQGALELIEPGENGLIFESGNAQDLADQLNFLIENPKERSRLGRAARSRVLDFSPEKVMKIWDELLTGFEKTNHLSA